MYLKELNSSLHRDAFKDAPRYFLISTYDLWVWDPHQHKYHPCCPLKRPHCLFFIYKDLSL
uniref:Uncharacterized protein n=1 Tax=Manihot esculenta TaxID=3983 RepID=A0A2C9V4T6_MANES